MAEKSSGNRIAVGRWGKLSGWRADGVAVGTGDDVFIRHRDAVGGTGAVETDQTLLGNGAVLFAVDVGDALMPQGSELIHQLADAVYVIGEHRSPVVEHMVDRDQRQIAVSQLHDLGVVKLYAGGDHTVNAAVAAML